MGKLNSRGIFRIVSGDICFNCIREAIPGEKISFYLDIVEIALTPLPPTTNTTLCKNKKEKRERKRKRKNTFDLCYLTCAPS